MRPDTLAIHFAQEPDPATGALATPIHATSTFVQEAPGVHQGFDYSRTNNPTRRTLERVLAALEGVEHCAAFASGLAAENAVLQALLAPGDHVITTPDVYGGTFRLLNAVHGPKGIAWTQADLSDERALEAAFRPGPSGDGRSRPGATSDGRSRPGATGAGRSRPGATKLLWLETPTNPRLLVYDVEKVCALAHRRGALVVVDNTFASPVNQQPFALGADLVVHSVTKYLSGHSDLIQGAVLARDAEVFAPVKFLQNATGAVPSPFDCWLTLRGLKTLGLRVQRHNENAQRVAEFLAEHPAVARTYHPGLASHPGHDVAARQMTGFGGMVSVELRAEPDAVRRFVSSLRYFKLGESLGGVRSLVCHPASMTHASIPAADRRRLGLSDALVRLSVGIEDVRDLVEDLAEGLEALKPTSVCAAAD